MKFKVLEYLKHVDAHKVENISSPEDGYEYMDLMIGPSLFDKGITPQDLVGKVIEVQHRHVYMWMADDLEIVVDK